MRQPAAARSGVALRRRAAAFAIASVLAGAWLGTSRSVLAQTPDTVMLEELTWTEVAGAVRAGKTTIIIPVGGTEQSGPYVALGKHNRRVVILSERIARRLGDALVAPVVAYVPEGTVDPPSEHMRFAGTITVPADAFEQTIASAAESFRAHGFLTVVLLGDHGGYQDQLAAVARRLNRRWAATPARAVYAGEYYRALRTFATMLRVRGLGAYLGTHADVSDTSLMLATDPSMVRMKELLTAPKPGAALGVDGDPRRATAALGRLGANEQVSQTVQAIRRSRAHRPRERHAR